MHSTYHHFLRVLDVAEQRRERGGQERVQFGACQHAPVGVRDDVAEDARQDQHVLRNEAPIHHERRVGAHHSEEGLHAALLVRLGHSEPQALDRGNGPGELFSRNEFRAREFVLRRPNPLLDEDLRLAGTLRAALLLLGTLRVHVPLVVEVEEDRIDALPRGTVK